MNSAAGIALLTLAALPGALPAAADAPPDGVWTLLFENDFFYNSDNNYTSGLGLAWAAPPNAAPEWAVESARRLPWFPVEGVLRHGYVMGQNVYTPQDVRLADPPRDDRPYAGWLYGAIGLGIEAGALYDQVALTLGVIGPASLGEAGQKAVHKIKGAKATRGWDTQLKNEPGIVLSYQRNWRGVVTTTLAGLDLDVMPHVGGALGNVHTYANTGAMLRLGRRMVRDLGPLRIAPNPPVSGYFAPSDGVTWYLFVGVDGRAVARNIFLDGNTFQDSRSVDKKPFVGELHTGFAMTWRALRVTYTHVQHTREFETQTRGEEYGAIAISMAL